MEIVKYQNEKWHRIDSDKINESLDELTDEELLDFTSFEVGRLKDDGLFSDSLVDCKLAKPVIDLLTSKYGNKTFCVIDNFQDCGIMSQAYLRLADDPRYLAYWHFNDLEKFINKEEVYRKGEYEACQIFTFSIFDSWNKGNNGFDGLRLERYLNDLLEQIENKNKLIQNKHISPKQSEQKSPWWKFW